MGTFLIQLKVIIILQITLQSVLINAKTVVDLTYAFNNETVLFPGLASTFNTNYEGYTERGYWYSTKSFCISEHTGTHVDSPYHFSKNGRTLDQIPLEDFIDVPGIMIDVYHKVHRFENGKLNVVENYEVTREDIIAWEQVNGQIPSRSVVLIRTGWGVRWPSVAQYQGLDANEKNAVPNVTSGVDFDFDNRSKTKLNFPGLAASGAKFLTSERQILGVGIDTLSIDVGPSQDFPAHVILAARQVYILENVANTHLLPARDFRLFVVPLKVEGGTGAPARILAFLNSDSK